MKLSAVIIAKNAEGLIKDCIESVRFCDEILVIDDSSTDKTKEIAKELGARVIEEHAKSFAEKRNIGLRFAKGEWVFYIDTDERVNDSLCESIMDTVSSIKNLPYVAYKVRRQNFYLGNHPWPMIERLERLFKKSQLKEWYGELHESPKIDGEVGELKGLLLHYTHRDLSSMLAKTIVWSDAEAKLRFNAHHPKMTWWRFPRVMMTAFIDSYFKQGGWKAGAMGIIESIYQAFSIFITYAKLWELQQSSNHP